MTKSPLFSTYRTGENRVTASMLAVFERIDPGAVETLLAAVSGESSVEFVTFSNQVASSGSSVPDAAITASFRYLFEVKTARATVRRKQLQDHLDQLDRKFSNERLFVLSPDGAEPAAVTELGDPRVVWFNFRHLHAAIDDLLRDESTLTSDQTRFLLRELQALFAEESLLDQADTVLVAARVAYPEYLKYGLYVCQAGRSFREGLARLGFYTAGAVQPEVPSVLGRVDNVTVGQLPKAALAGLSAEARKSLRAGLDEMLADGVRRKGDSHQVFILSRPDDPRTLVLEQPIPNTLPHAFTQHQRYVASTALASGPPGTAALA